MAEKKPTYWELLKHPKWQQKRLEVLQAANFECSDCGSGELTLHVHHTYYERGLKPWEYPAASLHALCEECHRKAQDILTLLHRQIGRIDLSYVEELYGYALAIEAATNPDLILDIFSYGVAVGVARYYSMNPSFLISFVVDGQIDAATLHDIAANLDAYAKVTPQTPQPPR